MVESVQLRTAANEPNVEPRDTASQDQRGEDHGSGDSCRWRASPPVVTVQRVREHSSTGCGDDPTHREGRPRKSTTRRPIPPVVTDRVRHFVGGYSVASAAERRRQLRLRAALINRYRRLIITE
jgi:hypothetical protein